MTFSHDTEQALGTLVRLVNTLPGPNSQVDTMETLEDLEKFVQEREFSAVGIADGQGSADVRDLRPLFAPVFTTESDAEAAAMINAIVAQRYDDAAADEPRRSSVAHPLFAGRLVADVPDHGRVRDRARPGDLGG